MENGEGGGKKKIFPVVTSNPVLSYKNMAYRSLDGTSLTIAIRFLSPPFKPYALGGESKLDGLPIIYIVNSFK